MGLFQRQAKIKKTTEGDKTQVLVNYFHVKNPLEYKFGLIKDLIGKNLCLMIVDTRYKFAEANADKEEDALKLLKSIDESSIKYNNIISFNDASVSVLGISIKLDSKKKVKNNTIGLIITSDDLDKFKDLIDKYCIFYYIAEAEMSPDEMLEGFNNAHGEIDVLFEQYSFNIVDNSFTNQIKITLNNEKSGYVDEVVKKNS